jgi:hypothetical protein
MKSLLLFLFTSLLFSNCAPVNTSFTEENPEPTFTTQKIYPAITISSSQRSLGYYRDGNGVLHEYESNNDQLSIQPASTFSRIIKRTNQLPENQFTRYDRMSAVNREQ